MNRKSSWLILFYFLSTSVIAQQYNNEWIDYSKSYYKFNVFGFGTDAANSPVRNGMVRISSAALTGAGLGNVASEHLQLWHDGEEVPVYVSKISGTLSNTDYIEFYGEINSGKLDKSLYPDANFQLANKWSLQTDTAAYFLTVNTTSQNKRFAPTANTIAGTMLPVTDYFFHTAARYYRAGTVSSGFSTSVGEDLYSSSYDGGEGWASRSVRPVACGGATSLPQSFGNLQPYLTGPDMILRVNSVGNAPNSRMVKVNLNSQQVSVFQMDYTNFEKIEEQVPVSMISSGNADFVISDQSPTACDEMRVASIELTYPRKFNFGNASIFEFSLEASSAGRYLKIANFNSGGVAPVLYDLANNKRYVGDISIPDTVQFVLEPSYNFNVVLTTQAGTYYKSITNFQTRNFVDYSKAVNQGNYLIISNPLIYGSGSANYVEQYNQYRKSNVGGGYASTVVDINELVDQFAWGVKKHPLSIKNFLLFARNKFTAPPKFAFLIGKGVTYNEYRANESNSLIEQLNLVPTWGNPASDNLLASENFTAVPAIPIGRLSAISAEEVGDYLKKVKQYDSAQASTTYTLDNKGWMKNVLQIAGANDIGLGNQLDGYMDGYKTIISDTAFGANVINFSKAADPEGYTEAIISFKKVYEKGASLITYFGHSSSTSLDFNLDDPQIYNNQNKYPFFIANGCSAGNHFGFEINRFNNKSTISERFVLAPNRGAIGYLASTHYGVINYLDLYTREFYKAASKTKYNQSFGEIVKEAISRSLDSSLPNDFFARIQGEQYALHGDPAIKFNTTLSPDYVVEEPEIIVSPSFVSVVDSNFIVKVRINNIGKVSSDSVNFRMTREFPDGRLITIVNKKIRAIKLIDSVVVKLPVVGNRDLGVHKVTAFIDNENNVAELSDSNNAATKQITITEDEIKPVYPYNYAIVNDAAVKLKASTVNPLSLIKNYVFEIDTTQLFNSPAKVSKQEASAGGIVEVSPGITYVNGKTYYWRVAPAGINNPKWNEFSFTYKNGNEAGFQQGHLYQNLNSQLTRLIQDSTTGTYKFTDKIENLFITQSIYPTSGTEDTHFSISVNGTAYIKSACIGSSVIFNVFDPLTFKPRLNTTTPGMTSCGPGREYNYEYSYRSPQSRKEAMDFLDAIPTGSFVAVRLILDGPYNVFAKDWAADTAIYGSSNSLYHRLKEQGFTKIDSFYYARTWAFVFKKSDPSFTAQQVLSDGVYDRVNLNVNCNTPNVRGIITSPKFGKAKQWKQVLWRGFSNEANNDDPLVEVIGIDNNSLETVLYTLNITQQDFDVSAVNALQYPSLRLRMINVDSTSATPYQLTSWSITYTPIPEGAIAPNYYFNIPDTATNILHTGVAFKNVSVVGFDSLTVKLTLFDTLNNVYPLGTKKLRALPAGDTLHINLDNDISRLSEGWYNILIEANPNELQPEQYSFNNFLYKYVYVKAGSTLPVTLLNFNAILKGNKVETNWVVTAEENIKQYEVEHSTTAVSFANVGSVKAVNGAPNKSYLFDHLNPKQGKNFYRLKIIEKDRTFKYSPTRLVNVGRDLYLNIYPNPVTNKLIIVVTDKDGKGAQVKLLSTSGQVLLKKHVSGTLQVDVEQLAAGTYVVQVDDGITTRSYKINKQ
ncbi:MAG: type sorting protein [Segetibacter sp.]|nr:type sorting protein [Segetibacter sp.]